MRRSLALLALFSLGACPTSQVKRTYPDPAPAAILEHLHGLRERASSLNADTKTDVRLGKDRVNVTVMMLAAWGGKLRFQALDPNNSTAADLASDGREYCFVDAHANCSECGVATAETVARLVRIPLEPDQVVAVLLGSTPLLEDAEPRVEWEASGGHEIVTLTRGDEVQRLVLDGRERRWDVLESQLTSGGKVRWKLRHKGFHDVKTADGKVVRLPGDSLFEEGGDTVRITWKDQRVGVALDESKFRMTPPPALPACGAAKR